MRTEQGKHFKDHLFLNNEPLKNHSTFSGNFFYEILLKAFYFQFLLKLNIIKNCNDFYFSYLVQKFKKITINMIKFHFRKDKKMN